MNEVQENQTSNVNQEPNPQTVNQNTQPFQTFQTVQVNTNIPLQFKPLSAWAYFGYKILFSIPIIGFIFLIVFSFSDSNINRRSFARSYWCGLLLVLILALIIFLIIMALGGLNSIDPISSSSFY